MRKFNSMETTGRTVDIGCEALVVKRFLPETMNEGKPWTIRDIMIDVLIPHVLTPFIVDEIISLEGIDPKYLPIELDLTGVDFEGMSLGELSSFWSNLVEGGKGA